MEESASILNLCMQISPNISSQKFLPGGGGKLGRGVQPASQNPHPIYDQNLWFSLPYLWPDQKFNTLFMNENGCFSL